MMTIELSDRDFEKISKLVYVQCGINLHDGKRELVKACLGKRLQEGNYKGSMVNKFYGSLKKDGYFVAGHSESLTSLQQPFKYIEPSVYQK